MSNPAEHSARDEAERRGQPFVGSDEDFQEALLLAEAADDEPVGCWLLGERGAA